MNIRWTHRTWMRGMVGIGAAALLLGGCQQAEPSSAAVSAVSNGAQPTTAALPWLATKNTTRINSSDPVEAAVLVSRTLWPAVSEAGRPGGVVLVNPDNWQTAAASADLVHHPNNGPVLYAHKDRIPDATLQELKRLRPSGSAANGQVQVILVGDFDASVAKQLQGYKTDGITGATPAEIAANIDAYYAKVAGELPASVIIGSSEQPDFTLPAVNWIAHMPEPLLYARKDELPAPTAEALKRRNGKANIYIMGPESVISAAVEQQLAAYGRVQRIAGKDAYEQAIAFAKFKDPANGFGWGIASPGRNVSLVSRQSPPALAIAAAPFAHLGKHAPLLWTDASRMPESVMAYVMQLQPVYDKTPSDGPFSHAWITGGEKELTYTAQDEIDAMLEIRSASGAGHGGGAGHAGASQTPSLSSGASAPGSATPSPAESAPASGGQSPASSGGHSGH